MKDYRVKIIDKKKAEGGVFVFIFEKPEGFKFRAGQYLKIMLDFEGDDPRGNSRYFTISASPLEKNLTITTRIEKSLFKKTLDSLSRGSVVDIRGPYGVYILDESERPKVFITGGLGITPARSMIKYSIAKKLRHKLTLLAFFSLENSFVYYEELKRLEDQNIKPLFIDSSSDGKLNIDKMKKFAPDFLESKIYISGSEGFVSFIEKMVKKAGVTEDDIISEDLTNID